MGSKGAPKELEGYRRLLAGVLETCELFGGISRGNLYSLLSRGEIPAPVKLGGRTFWRIVDVENFLRAKSEEAQRALMNL